MKVRRMLTAVAACALTSFALVTASAQAAPSPAQVGLNGGKPGIAMKVKKVKGAKVYNMYFDPYVEEVYLGYHQEPPFLVFAKTKTWGFELEPGVGTTYGTYETVKVKVNKEKYTYNVFYYNDMGEEDTYLLGYVTKVPSGWDNGEYVLDGTYEGAWYAEKT
jgi:hypothetical protein